MKQRLTFLLLLPTIMILSFTPSKQVKSPEIKKVAAPVCGTFFHIELVGCQMPNFYVDYVVVNGQTLDANVACANYSGRTYIGPMGTPNGPGTITVHYVGAASMADLYEGDDMFSGWLGGWFPNGSNTITMSTELWGCGKEYTIRVHVKKNSLLQDPLNKNAVSAELLVR